MSEADTTQAEAAHEEYLVEARQLVDEHINALFQMIEAAAAHSSGVAPGTQRGVARGDHSITVSTGDRRATFEVEAITDLPEGSDRAKDFATGQARCIMRAPDGATKEWVLHRVGAGAAAPPYTWMDAATGQQLTEDDLTTLLGQILGA